MAGRGVYFALEPERARQLRDAPSDEARLDLVQEEIEEEWGQLSFANGAPPLYCVVLGGERERPAAGSCSAWIRSRAAGIEG
ncbi:MAG: hypothetical protein QNK05_16615 [Myxococcota bacterium]|nr:hypothetical protein [Myxococcota bacterium]